MKKYFFIIYVLTSFYLQARAENGYELWLRYPKVENARLLNQYRYWLSGPVLPGNSPTCTAIRYELEKAIPGLTGQPVRIHTRPQPSSRLLITLEAPPGSLPYAAKKILGTEGYIIRTHGQRLIITANTDIGLLYGAYHLLRLLQTGQDINSLDIRSYPAMQLRMLNHWDNLDRTVERGYAGFSIWNWHTLPAYKDPRYTDYARANASIGINGTVLTNVNANATVLSAPYLQKVKALADIFRPYGIKVYLTARFSAPIESGSLKTADPLDPAVQQWWKEKVNEIYTLIPDFGGFLVKANSEGQPGPQDYKRTHADGANMLADAMAPHKGIVIWRAFVYAAENPADRHKQAYDDFVPLDGKFRDNVMVQVKNGAIDFMPREPFHPLFGAMPKTPLMMEFQVTQEYLGQGTHLVYLAPLFKEVLESDTYAKGKGSTVARVIDGSLYEHALNGMAGVANIGNDINWCGHAFAQANWYALGRLAWNHQLNSESIAEEWLKMSFSSDPAFIIPVRKMMMESRETLVNYMNPLGLHHIMGTGHHYGPAPWVSNLSRPEWNPVYYHKADSTGIGFNRTASGSNALAQYQPEAARNWTDPLRCDERFLLWFHHIPWKRTLSSGRSLWEELCYRYYTGAETVSEMIRTWEQQKKRVDNQRFREVQMLLQIQQDEARWWRDACILYFQTFSRLPLPAGYEQPGQTLLYYQSLRFPYAPGH